MQPLFACREHGFCSHILRRPWCEQLNLAERVTLVVLTILTAGILLLVGCCVLATPEPPRAPEKITLFCVNAVSESPMLHCGAFENPPESECSISPGSIVRIAQEIASSSWNEGEIETKARQWAEKVEQKGVVKECFWMRGEKQLDGPKDTVIEMLGWQANFMEKLLLALLVGRNQDWGNSDVQALAKQLMLVHYSLVLRICDQEKRELNPDSYASLALVRGATFYQTFLARAVEFRPPDQVSEAEAQRLADQSKRLFSQELGVCRVLYNAICEKLETRQISFPMHLQQGQSLQPHEKLA